MLFRSGSSSVSLASKPYVPEAQQLTLNDHLRRLRLPATASLHPHSGFQIQWQPGPDGPLVLLPLAIPGAPTGHREQEMVDLLRSAGIDGLRTLHSDQTVAELVGSWSEASRIELNHALLAAWLGEGQPLGGSHCDPVILFYRTDLIDLSAAVVAEVVHWAEIGRAHV